MLRVSGPNSEGCNVLNCGHGHGCHGHGCHGHGYDGRRGLHGLLSLHNAA